MSSFSPHGVNGCKEFTVTEAEWVHYRCARKGRNQRDGLVLYARGTLWEKFFSQRSSLPRKPFAVGSVMPPVNSWQGPTYSKSLMTCSITAWEMTLKIKAWKFFADSTMPAYLSFSTWPRLSLIYIWNMRGFFSSDPDVPRLCMRM